MTWTRFLLYLLVAVGGRWALAHVTKRPEALLLGSLAILLAVAFFIEKGRHAYLAQRLSRASAEELPAVAASISPENRAMLQLHGVDAGSDAFQELLADESFRYPAGSRLLLASLAAACLVFGLGMLVPLAVHGTDDPANDWILFVAGVLFLLAARGYGGRLVLTGRTVTVTSQGIQELWGEKEICMAWHEIASLRSPRFNSGMIFSTQDGRRITVLDSLHDYRRFALRVLAHLRRISAS